MQAKDRIIFALDVPTAQEAQSFVDLLTPHVGGFKVGLEQFISAGKLPETSAPIVLDMKLHDIPETVERSITAAAKLGAKYVTMHVQQRETMERAAKKSAELGITVLAVTVLTSMTNLDLLDLYQSSRDAEFFPGTALSTRVLNLAFHAKRYGVSSFVCSPQEVGKLKVNIPNAFCMVPGIRPAGADLGDQKRVGTPAQAVREGADLLVIGRPIRDAKDPVQAAQDIASSIERG